MDTHEYSQISKDLTNTLSKPTKREHGIYFTPPSTVHAILDTIDPHVSGNIRILEPSCGSGEFVRAMCDRYKSPGIRIDAIENNSTIFETVAPGFGDNERVSMFNEDYLSYHPESEYDLIIGNPPFFVMKKTDVDAAYYSYFDGRPNIFLLFIIKSLGHLRENGILCFVLPKSFLNCLYYDKTRTLINTECVILNISKCADEYIETKQETVVVVLQKKLPPTPKINSAYVMTVCDHTIFGTCETIEELRGLYENSTTLSEMGFDVNVGTVVWNQCKSILTDDANKTRLIYSSDIEGNTLGRKEYVNPQKKNFIDKSGHTGPLLVVNRGYGTGNYAFQYCLINSSQEYLVENHLICIRCASSVTKKKLLEMYRKIITSLQNNKTTRFIQLYFGNNAINTTELKHMLPIFL